MAIVKDNSPRENKQVGAQLWNGDAIEIAFSTNPKADKKRQFLMLSDQHLGINCGPNPYVWNWKVNEQMKDVLFSLNNNENGYILEMAIPISSFKNFELVSGSELDLEIAIDLGSGDKRDLQVKWNSLYEEGFHTNPSLWGELKIK